MKERLAALSARVTELEEDLDTARKDLIKSEEVNTKLQRDVREVSEKSSCSAAAELNVWGLWPDGFAHFVPDPLSGFQPLRDRVSNSKMEECRDTDRPPPILWRILPSPRSLKVATWSCWSLGLAATEWTCGHLSG